MTEISDITPDLNQARLDYLISIEEEHKARDWEYPSFYHVIKQDNFSQRYRVHWSYEWSWHDATKPTPKVSNRPNGAYVLAEPGYGDHIYEDHHGCSIIEQYAPDWDLSTTVMAATVIKTTSDVLMLAWRVYANVLYAPVPKQLHAVTIAWAQTSARYLDLSVRGTFNNRTTIDPVPPVESKTPKKVTNKGKVIPIRRTKS